MLSLSSRKTLSSGFLFSVKNIRNCRLNGGVPDAKSARAARKSRAGGVEGSETKKFSVNPKVACAAAALAVGGLCIYSIQTNKETALGKLYWGSAFEQSVSASYQYLFGWVGQIFVPYEDKLLPDWPSDPVN